MAFAPLPQWQLQQQCCGAGERWSLVEAKEAVREEEEEEEEEEEGREEEAPPHLPVAVTLKESTNERCDWTFFVCLGSGRQEIGVRLGHSS